MTRTKRSALSQKPTLQAWYRNQLWRPVRFCGAHPDLDLNSVDVQPHEVLGVRAAELLDRAVRGEAEARDLVRGAVRDGGDEVEENPRPWRSALARQRRFQPRPPNVAHTLQQPLGNRLLQSSQRDGAIADRPDEQPSRNAALSARKDPTPERSNSISSPTSSSVTF